MKKVILLVFSILCVLNANSAVRTVENAIFEARSFEAARSGSASHAIGRSTSVNDYELAFSVNKTGSSQAALYVIKSHLTNGFVVVSADDCAKTILGYSDEGIFDMNNIPENMQKWLEYYADEISWANSHIDIDDAPIKDDAEDPSVVVAPLLKLNGNSIKWGQSAPFNDLCPKMAGQRCPSGCVATAVSQIMYYWQYPEHGFGSHSYEWVNPVTQKSKVLSADFENTVYAWGDMLGEYNPDSYTEEQAAAVAQLLYQVGIACEMDYNHDGSGSYSVQYVPSALFKYFGYMPTTVFFLSNGVDEFEDLLINELQNGRPVYMSGASSSGGHAFVCDGINEAGMFHINWGWDGSSNGYFAITALNPKKNTPKEQGYNSGVCAICNIVPDYNLDYAPVVTTDIVASSFTMNNADTTTVSRVLSFYADSVVNLGYENFSKCVYKIAVLDAENDSVVALYGDANMNDNFFSGLVFVGYTNMNDFKFTLKEINESLNTPLQDGEYYFQLLYDVDRKFANPVPVRVKSGQDKYYFSLNGNKVVFHNSSTGVERIEREEPSFMKYYENGRVIIRKGNMYYDVYGMPVSPIGR